MREVVRHPIFQGSAWAVDLICIQVDTPPLEWSAIVGDIVQNLRAVLDHLVCQLTIAGGGDCEQPKSQFVIAYSRADFDSQAKNRMSLIDDRSRGLFEAIQPYHALDWPQRDGSMVYRHPLATLQRLSNFDKHRLPLLSMFGPGRLRVEDVSLTDAEYGGYSFPTSPYRVGETVCSVYYMPTGPAPAIEFDANPEPHVSLDDGLPLLDTLEGAAHFVAGVLIEHETAA
jgi:hypothetical protein